VISAILIAASSVIGLYFSLRKTGFFQKFISVGLAVSVFITWIGNKDSLLVSLLLQVGLAFVSIIYAFSVNGLKVVDRFSIAAIGLVLTLGTLTIILHYPGQMELRLALAIPLALFLSSTIQYGRQQPKEFGFMIIWSTQAAVQLTNYLIH
jgi:hypothetical protein